MTKTFTCTQARARLASLCKDVTDDSDYVIITRAGQEDVALISASERNCASSQVTQKRGTTGNSTKPSQSWHRTLSIYRNANALKK